MRRLLSVQSGSLCECLIQSLTQCADRCRQLAQADVDMREDVALPSLLVCGSLLPLRRLLQMQNYLHTVPLRIHQSFVLHDAQVLPHDDTLRSYRFEAPLFVQSMTRASDTWYIS